MGDLRVVVSTEAPPTPMTSLPGGVRLVTAFHGTRSRTQAPVSGGATGDISCGTVTVHGAKFAALSGGPAPAGAPADDLYDGDIALALVVTDPSPLAAAPAVPSGVFPVNSALQSYLAGRSGRASVAMFDATSGATYSYNAGAHHATASIVKVAILATLLRQAQAGQRSLTSSERSLAARMIELSDNNAATALWNEVGQGNGVKAFMDLVGMPSTTPGPDGLWGLTSTTATDQVSLLRSVAYPNAVLSDTRRSYLESLMRSVTPSQRWGVSAGVGPGTTVALKNGWLPVSGGWIINSIGHVRGGTRDYVVAALTSGDPSMSYGITTVQHVSGLVWQSADVSRLSDFTGDGVPDIVARDTTGGLWLYPGNGSGGFQARHEIGGGWDAYTALVTPGDVTGDGRADVLARDGSGDLWLYPGNGVGGLGPRRRIGSGWNDYTIADAANLRASARPQLVARDSAGALWLYPFSGTAVIGRRSQIKGAWGGFSVTGPGDVSGDAYADLLARDATGALWLYPGNGAGGLGPRRLVGAGWSTFTTLVTPGDWDRSGGNDLLARDAVGRLWLYPGNNAGGFATPRQIGHGWQNLTFVG